MSPSVSSSASASSSGALRAIVDDPIALAEALDGGGGKPVGNDYLHGMKLRGRYEVRYSII